MTEKELQTVIKEIHDSVYEQGKLDGRSETIKEIMKKAEKIQLEQIENLNNSDRKNGKMWARYMSTYLGHIQSACRRMLELEE